MMKIEAKVVNNYLLNLLYQLFTLFTPLITVPYLSRILGAENLGIYSFTLAIATYFMVFGSLGFPIYGQREIAFTIKKIEQRSQIFCEICTLQFLLVSGSSILYFLFVCSFVDSSKAIFFAQTIAIFSHAIEFGWFFNGIENFKVTVLRNVLFKSISIVCIFIFVNSEKDLLIYTLIMGLGNLLSNLCLFIDLKKHVNFCRTSLVKSLYKHFKNAFLLGIPLCLTTLYSVLDKSILVYFDVGFSEIGFYDLSQKIILVVIAITTALPTVLLPRFSYLALNNRTKDLKELLNEGLQLLCFLALPLVGGLFIVGDMITPWFFGSGYEKTGRLIQIGAPLVFLVSIANLLGTQYLVAIKKERVLIYFVLTALIINLVVNVVLIKIFGVSGAVFSAMLSESIKVILLLIYLKNDIVLTNVLPSFINYASLSASLTVLFVSIKNVTHLPYTLTTTFMLVVTAIGTYLFCLKLMKDPILTALINIRHQ